MPENPTTEGPEKSLRQRAPGGDVVAVIFGLIAAYFLLGVIVNRPENPAVLVLVGVFILAFAVPAYLLWASARTTGIFVTDDRVEYRALGRVREGWPRGEVKAIEAMSGGLKILGNDGRLLRQYRFRWWSMDQGSRFARSCGLSPELTPTAAAPASAEAHPGEPGDR